MRILNLISTYKHYEDEKSGIKPYTIRDYTIRLERLSNGATHVRIQKGYTKEHFYRKITHTLDWKDNRIFAWNPNDRFPYARDLRKAIKKNLPKEPIFDSPISNKTIKESEKK